jgi:hypothetical protein
MATETISQGKYMLRKLMFVALSMLISSTSHAALVLTIDTYTTDELSLTFGGSFDLDSVGDQPGFLAIKNDWSNNFGIQTEMFSRDPVVTVNTVLIGGLLPSATYVYNGNMNFMDSIFFGNPLNSSSTSGGDVAFTAGTTVSGSLTLTGLGIFDPTNAATLELVSGYNDSAADWVRLEAGATAVSPVPVPAALWLFGTALIGLVGFGKCRKTT